MTDRGAPQLPLPSTIPISPTEPRLPLEIEGEPIESFLATGATFSASMTRKGPLSKTECNVKGVSAKGNTRKVLEPLTCEIGSKPLKHPFLGVPESPIPLAGGDLRVELGAA